VFNHTLTANEAWQPFVPDAQSPFDRTAAAHLFRRAGFSATFAELDRAVEQGPQATVKALLQNPSLQPFDAEMVRMADSVLAVNNPEALASWWLYRMRFTPAPLAEKLTLFWHGHFATSAAKVNNARLMYRQSAVLRAQACGVYGDFVKAMARDPAMLLYLDSATNRKNHPNENFAREVLELFCLGPGNYSERDIQQLARCFTGWEIQHGEFKFHSYQHDFGKKTIFQKTGEWDGDDAIRVILQQPAAADFLCRKLVRFFVTDDSDESATLIQPLAEQLRESDYQIGPLVETILTSRAFYSPEARGSKVRAPVELGIGLLRALDTTTNMTRLAVNLRDLGQLPLFPPNVKGWKGGREWLNASTLLGRINTARELIETPGIKFGEGSLDEYLSSAGLNTATEVVDGLCELLLAVVPPTEVRQQLKSDIEKNQFGREASLKQLAHSIASLPEYQLN
jgi:uncharacterized protein (DUF1800 family)